MKIQSVFLSLLKLFFTFSFLVFLSSCSSVYTQQVNRNSDKQMGELIQSSLSNQTELSESQIAKVIHSVVTAEGSSEFSTVQINTIVTLYNQGLISSVVKNDFEGLLLLKKDSQPVKNNKIQTLFTLFPSSAKSIASNLLKYSIYKEDELLEVALSSNLDPSTILQAAAAGVSPGIFRIGWGGGGAFSSVIEFNDEVYASSDVTGVWKFNGTGWDPLVSGLTNYNITGLLVHEGTLLAATKNQILKLVNGNTWTPIGLKLKTYRHTTLQLFSTSAIGTTCFAALEPSLGCIDNSGNTKKVALSISELKGIYFSESNSDYVFGYNGKELYRINIVNGTHSLEYSFPNSIVRILELKRDGSALVFTKRGVYELDSFTPVSIDLKNKSIVNVLIDTTADGNHLIALGNTWNSNIYKLILKGTSLTVGKKISVKYDTTLPFRQWRQSMTKPLGMPTSVWGKLWFSDFWGIYAYDVGTSKIYEKSRDASNIVGTDIHIANNKLYITSMDNGLVSMKLNEPNVFTSIFPRLSSDWLLAGHVWSVENNERGVFASLSPWNLPQDYLITADNDDNFLNVQKIDDATSRSTSETFWGQSYSRKLIIADGILVYKDGSTGGLYRLTDSAEASSGEIAESSSEVLFSTDNNRVYRAIAIHNNYLVSYHIDDEKKLYFNDIHTGELIDTIEAPTGLWAFSIEVIDDQLYLLGSLGGAVIYKLNELDRSFNEILRAPEASAFMSLKKAPDDSVIIAGAVEWSGKPYGQVLVKTEGNEDWIDMTCLMPNESGVVDIEFSENSEFVYLLQYVGAVIKVSINTIENHGGC